MKKALLFTILFGALLFGGSTHTAHAAELTPNLTLSNGGSTANLTDTSHYTSVTCNNGDTITVTAKDGSSIYGLYITWDSKPVAWTLTTDNGELSCGENGFLHEYVALESPSSSLTIRIPKDSMRVDGIRIFGEGELPHDVQVWNSPCERADIMVVSSHADDEILFFGGILPTYAYLHDADIQVVYLCEFWTTTRVREHEKLDGLWESGIRFYPVCGDFYDTYADDLADAKSKYNYGNIISYLVSQIRAFQPQVLVTHDIYGEYGHGFHILTCNALMEAVELAADAEQYPESFQTYGCWNTPKTYLHLFPANAIRLDLHVPIEEDYAGRTALEIAKKAYTKHVSQQWCWFYVSDEYEYSCADFGLYRSLVGADTGNDLLCNLKTYKVQAAEKAARLEAERIAAEEAAAAAKKAEEERLAAEEAARIEAERLEAERIAKEEAARLEEERLASEKAEAERLAAEEAARIEAEKKAAADAEAFALHNEIDFLSAKLSKAETLAYILAGSTVVCLLAAILFFVKNHTAKNKKTND